MPSVLTHPVGDGIWQLTMNRPEKRNALDAAQWDALTMAVRALAENPEVACLILTGAGSAFASGGDIAAFTREVGAPDGPRLFRERIQHCLDALDHFPAPTMARVNGAAIGGGVELALACDVRIAADVARFAIPAVRFGMVMAFPDFRRLIAAVGPHRARFLAMTGASIEAEEAQRIGLAHVTVPIGRLDEETMRVARWLTHAERSASLWFRKATDLVESGMEPPEGFRRYEEECLAGNEFRRRVEAYLRPI